MPPLTSSQATATAAVTSAAAQRAQAGLGTVVESLLTHAWEGVDIEHLDETLPLLFQMVAALVQRYGRVSASLAARFYTEQRHAAGVTSKFTTTSARLPDLNQLNATVGWATAPLREDQPDLELAKQQLAQAVDRLVLGVGRETIIQNVKRDRQATGWARVPELGCCSFCALLASRGAVYKEQTVDFKAHNGCRCHAEPVFARAGYQPSAEIRQWQAMYDQVKGRGSAAAVRREFRRAFEGAAQQHPAHA